MRDPGRLQPKEMLGQAPRSWLDRMLDTKAISENAKKQREHDKQAVAAMRELLRERSE
jgi:hypothetical protein